MQTRRPSAPRTDLARVASYTLVVAAIVGLVLLAWLLRSILILFFAAVVFAVIVWSAAELIRRLVPVGLKASVAAACLLIALVLAGLFLLLGAQVRMQLLTLREAMPLAAAALDQRFGIDVQQWWKEAANITWIGGALGYVPGVFSVVSSLVLVIVGGIFLALDPQGHRDGVLMLVPHKHRPRLGETLNQIGTSLQRWLVGQLAAMIIIGVLTATVLAILGVPSALALGLIAGLLEFVPYAGAIVAYVPLGLAGVSQGMETFWWVFGAYVLIQQTEGNILMPLLQKRTVQLPPVLALFSIVAMAVVFGPLGVAFGVPLTVVLLVALQNLYIEDVLEKGSISSIILDDGAKKPGEILSSPDTTPRPE